MIKDIILLILCVIARMILYILGWELLDDQVIEQLTKHKYLVAVFSHTSYIDFYMAILYSLAYPYAFKDFRTLVKPQPFEYAGWLLRKFGAIPSTKKEDKNGGAVNRIVEDLKGSEQATLLISPKGTILKSEWRSGYYHIANQLDANLVAVGLDYEKKNVYVSEAISHTEGEPRVRSFLMRELSNIVPLHPDQEVCDIRYHHDFQVGYVEYTRIAVMVMMSLMMFVSYSYYSVQQAKQTT